MRKRALTFILPLMAAMLITGCGDKEEEAEVTVRPRIRDEAETAIAEPEPEAEPEPDVATIEPFWDGPGSEKPYDDAVYEPVLDCYYDMIVNGYDADRDYEYMSTGLMEELMYSQDKMIDTAGYLIKDISGDQVPELLIGRNEPADYESPDEVSTVYAVYTVKDREPVMVFEGMTRSSFRWLGDGHFYYFGSGGAMFTLFGECHLSFDGTENEWDDFYFTDEKQGGEIGFYHNTTGAAIADQSEELDIPEAEFWSLMSDHQFVLLDWDLFKDYKDGSAQSTVPAVKAEWADGVVDESTDYISYEPDYTDQYTTHILFSVDKTVKNFRIVELSMKDVDDSGHVEFLYEEKYKLDELTPEKPLCAGMNFPGDTPHNGYLITDDNGKDRLFIIDLSGRDGSLLNYEYE